VELYAARRSPQSLHLVVGRSNATGANITITGSNFGSGAGLHTYYMGVPGNELGPGQFVRAAADGTFSVTVPISFTSNNPDDALGYVTVVMQTGEGSRVLAIGSVSASYWVTNDTC
jgi:hypothetical protein